MDTHDASKVPELLQLSITQKANLRAALLRKGQPPQWHPRSLMHSQFLLKLAQRAKWESQDYQIGTSFVPPPYPPCVTPLSALTKAFVRDLVLETQHRGKYLLLRCVTAQDRMTAVMAMMEDERDEMVMLQLYHQEHPDQVKEEILVQGTTVLVKEPYLKMAATGGYALRADHVSDVEFLSPTDERIPRKWRTSPAEKTAAAWKETGNSHFNKARYRAAIEAYTEGLGCSPTDEERQVLILNRAMAHLKAGSFEKALADADAATLFPTASEKAPFRKAQALYGLARFRECCDVLKVLCSEHPSNTPAKELFRRAVARLSEETNGRYNFKAMYDEAAKLRPPHLDHATFVGPVEVRTSRISGGGRGLFTTAAVSAGDLLMCEKAFAHAYADEADPTSTRNVTILIDTATDNMSMGAHAELIDRLVRKMHQNPSLSKAVTDLHHGDYTPVEATSVDGFPVVDSFLVRRIIPLNTFGCPLTTLSSHPRTSSTPTLPSKDKDMFHSCGIWPLASYINHACTSNARRSFIGDMMIVRATRDLPADTEITWWYDPPPAEPTAYLERLRLLRKNWGFVCKCGECREARDTPESLLETRKALWGKLKGLVGAHMTDPTIGAVRNAEKALVKLAATYKRSPSEAPRLGVSTWQVSLAARYHRYACIEESLKMALESLRSLGFVIEGGDLKQGRPPVVKEWGLMLDHVVECWMFVLEVASLAAPHWAEAVRGYAKTAYRICYGEDETFEKTYGGKY